MKYIYLITDLQTKPKLQKFLRYNLEKLTKEQVVDISGVERVEWIQDLEKVLQTGEKH